MEGEKSNEKRKVVEEWWAFYSDSVCLESKEKKIIPRFFRRTLSSIQLLLLGRPVFSSFFSATKNGGHHGHITTFGQKKVGTVYFAERPEESFL